MIPRTVRPIILLVAFLIAASGAPARAGGFDQALGVWTVALEARLASLEDEARQSRVVDRFLDELAAATTADAGKGK